MGEVYRATDKKLGREVALKILPAEMAQDPDPLSRFRREARAVAALNHPNVGTLYSVEACDGMHFLTMELVEGVWLDRPVASGGLPVKQIIEIAGALSEALAAAHEEGIMHRNLKPANVVVPHDGRVEVLDFGLAKDVGAELSTDATLTSDGPTQAGIVMGTPAYMSPEQVSRRMLDHRTDIFSLGGCATGDDDGPAAVRGDFVGRTRVIDPARQSTDVRADLPSDLARVIRRCLEKDPHHRVPTARDVSNEFPRSRTTAVPPHACTRFSLASRGRARLWRHANRSGIGGCRRAQRGRSPMSYSGRWQVLGFKQPRFVLMVQRANPTG